MNIDDDTDNKTVFSNIEDPVLRVIETRKENPDKEWFGGALVTD